MDFFNNLINFLKNLGIGKITIGFICLLTSILFGVLFYFLVDKTNFKEFPVLFSIIIILLFITGIVLLISSVIDYSKYKSEIKNLYNNLSEKEKEFLLYCIDQKIVHYECNVSFDRVDNFGFKVFQNLENRNIINKKKVCYSHYINLNTELFNELKPYFQKEKNKKKG